MSELPTQDLLLLTSQPSHIGILLRRLRQHGTEFKGTNVSLVADLMGQGKMAALLAEIDMAKARQGVGELSVDIATRALSGRADGAQRHELFARLVDILVLLEHQA